MKKWLMDILACPVCKSELVLDVVREESGEVIEGNLTCKECGEQYPIKEGIPNMLPPEMRKELP